MGFFSDSIGVIAGYAVFLGSVAFVHRMYKVRMMVRRVHAQHGVPILPHSFLLGHLFTMAKIIIKHKLPPDVFPHHHYFAIQKDYPEIFEAGVLYLDPWPISWPIMIVFKPEMIAQFVSSPSLPKFYYMRTIEFGPLTGGRDVFTAEGQMWKEQHALFMPGFSSKNALAMTPWFVNEVLVFRDRMLKASKTGETVKLEQWAADLTLDVIARATLSQEQASPHWLVALKEQVKLMVFKLDVVKALNLLSPLQHWRYNRIFKKAIEPMIIEAFNKPTEPDGPQSIMGLAIGRLVRSGQAIPQQLLDDLVVNIKMFLYAGHVTTAMALSMLYWQLSQNPDKLALVREEHDRVLGPDPARAAEAILADVNILNKLTYTGAAIKEAMRLWPPTGGSLREANAPGYMITNPETGMSFPTHGFMISSGSVYLARDPKYWHRSDEYLPERFLVRDPNDPLHPTKNAWQPFSTGPRACIAQDLVQAEVRLAAALTLREFDIEPQYAADAPEFHGSKAYQTEDPYDVSGMRVKDGLPVKVIARKRPVG
ncbi:P450 monooxygenase [Escovopsis weberi]|uniref:p450 monooxygenase n=1 Tax=Escovopsis weberi TaxID=150374 RepID=A0A0M8MXE1_ESCWE|nr:P450 monooxygenase [Escovopsis weberi]